MSEWIDITSIDTKWARSEPAEELFEFCSMFGFKPVMREIDFDYGMTRYTIEFALRFGRSILSKKNENATSSYSREVMLRSTIDVLYRHSPSDQQFCNALHKLFEQLSGAELILRFTGKRTASSLGYTINRHERHMSLPEFGSMSELKLKLELMPGWTGSAV